MIKKSTAQKRFDQLVYDVQIKWGAGWPRLGVTFQQELVRGEILAEISRTPQNDTVAFRDRVSELTDLAIQWWPE
jgi:hypothetical protein